MIDSNQKPSALKPDFAREQSFRTLTSEEKNFKAMTSKHKNENEGRWKDTKVNMESKFKVLFSVPFETKLGESIAVVGSLKELGRWKHIKVNLTWTEGHIWKLLKPLEVCEQIFSYKYALVENKKIVKLESGIDRLVDCGLKWEQYDSFTKNESKE